MKFCPGRQASNFFGSDPTKSTIHDTMNSLNPKEFLVLTSFLVGLVATSAPGAERYLDLNGTAAGFGLEAGMGNGNASEGTADDLNEVQFDFSNNAVGIPAEFVGPWRWTDDPAGTGPDSTFADGDIAHFVLSGSGEILFEFDQTAATATSGIKLGGIKVSLAAGSTATIHRFQQDNETNGQTLIEWASGAVVDMTNLAYGFWWDFDNTGDYTVSGGNALRYGDGGVKAAGTVTLVGSPLEILWAGCVNTDSHFVLKYGGRLDLQDAGQFANKAIGSVNGSGSIVRFGSGDLSEENLILETGIDMTDADATGQILAGWGLSLALGPASSTTLEINKTGGTPEADQVFIDWGGETLTCGGSLTVTLLGGSEALVDGDVFDLFSDNLLGRFTSMTLPVLGAGLRWDISNLYVDGTIAVTTSPGAAGSVSMDYLTADYEIVVNPDSLVTADNVWKWEESGAVTWTAAMGVGPGTMESFNVPLADVPTSPEALFAPFYDPATTKLTAITPGFAEGDIDMVAEGNYGTLGIVKGWYEIVVTTKNAGPVYTGTSMETDLTGIDAATIEADGVTNWNALSWDTDPFAGGGVLLDDIDSVTMTVHARIDEAYDGATPTFLVVRRLPISYTATTFGGNTPAEITLTSITHGGSNVTLNWTTSNLSGGVDVFRNTGLDGVWTLLLPQNIGGGTYTDNALPAGGRAFYLLVPTGETP